MTRWARAFPPAAALLLCLATAGCGGKKHKFVPVEGVVEINGRPASNILVRFLPDGLKNNEGPPSSGITDEKGAYRLKSDKGDDGAVPGWHRVIFEDLNVDRPPQGQRQQHPTRLDAHWHTASTGVEIQLKDDKNSVPLKVTGPRR